MARLGGGHDKPLAGRVDRRGVHARAQPDDQRRAARRAGRRGSCANGRRPGRAGRDPALAGHSEAPHANAGHARQLTSLHAPAQVGHGARVAPHRPGQCDCRARGQAAMLGQVFRQHGFQPGMIRVAKAFGLPAMIVVPRASATRVFVPPTSATRTGASVSAMLDPSGYAPARVMFALTPVAVPDKTLLGGVASFRNRHAPARSVFHNPGPTRNCPEATR